MSVSRGRTGPILAAQTARRKALRHGFGRRKHDYQLHLGLDVVEVVRNAGRHEDGLAGVDRSGFAAGGELTTPPDDDVDLVLRVRQLAIDTSGGQDV